MTNRALRWISFGLAILALIASIAMLLSDAKPGLLSMVPASLISASPLLLVGISFLMLQPFLRPRSTELLKNALLALTFLLWGTIQLMPQSSTSIRLGNVVIALYVLDLAWMILGSKNSREKT